VGWPISVLVLATSGSDKTLGVIASIGFIAIGVYLVVRREDVARKRQAMARKRGADRSQAFLYQPQWAGASGVVVTLIGAMLLIGFLAK